MAERIIQCLGRRRITVFRTEQGVKLNVTLGDPPRGRHVACLELETVELEKLILELIEARANG